MASTDGAAMTNRPKAGRQRLLVQVAMDPQPRRCRPPSLVPSSLGVTVAVRMLGGSTMTTLLKQGSCKRWAPRRWEFSPGTPEYIINTGVRVHGARLPSGSGKRVALTPLPATQNAQSDAGCYARDVVPMPIVFRLGAPLPTVARLRQLEPGGLWAEQENNTKQATQATTPTRIVRTVAR